MRLMTLIAAALVAALAVPACSQGTATSGDGGASAIENRIKVMKTTGKNMGGIGDIMKNKQPVAPIVQHAQEINAQAKLMAAAFEKKVTEGKTDAKAEIWSNWDKFKEISKRLESESATLVQVASGGDAAAIGEQIKKVGGACKACHDDFRKPKEQSYKNM